MPDTTYPAGETDEQRRIAWERAESETDFRRSYGSMSPDRDAAFPEKD